MESSLAEYKQQVLEITRNFQEVVLSKVNSLLHVVLEKFTESDSEEIKFDNNKENIFNYLDECVIKIAGVKMNDSTQMHLRNKPDIYESFQCNNDTCKTIKYNFKLARKRVNKLKIKNEKMKTKLTDAHVKSKRLLKIIKYLTKKYYEHTHEINGKIIEIEILENKNKLLEADLQQIMDNLEVNSEHLVF